MANAANNSCPYCNKKTESKVSLISGLCSECKKPVSVRADKSPNKAMFSALEATQRMETAQDFGHYMLVKKKGEEKSKKSYEAYEAAKNRSVILKFLAVQLDEDVKKIFVENAKTTQGISLESIAPIFDFGEEEGRPYIVRELVFGLNLREWIQSSPSSFEENALVMKKVAQILQNLSQQSFYHGNLKPNNIILSKDLDPTLTDLSISYPTNEIRSQSRSWKYSAPETIQTGKLSVASDIYSFGIVLYELLTGAVPVSGVQPSDLEPERFFPPSDRNPDIPDTLDSLCLKCLEWKEEDRYSTWEEVLTQL